VVAPGSSRSGPSRVSMKSTASTKSMITPDAEVVH
jgi:hypothetical protein